MIIRTKGGEFRAGNKAALLDFLGVKQEAAGPQKVAGDVELVASAPFRLTAESEAADGLPWTLSTFDLDRFGERIDPAGWDCKCYRDNPVVEWAHRYDIPALGKMEGLAADDGGLHGLVVFNDKDYDPFGWAIGRRVKAGVIRAGSVGFRVIEIEIPDRETAKDGTTLIFRKQELLEFSICNVPANPFALAKAIAEGRAETKQDLCSSGFWGNIINNFEGA
ncbi:MAG: HK97 family phage prohead protease [Treponema sp.]|jgi:HK97 family phage prohead protease|nr:HK97 family phage prohead protease [Treponema sp.]